MMMKSNLFYLVDREHNICTQNLIETSGSVLHVLRKEAAAGRFA
jgi:hypothetical protein